MKANYLFFGMALMLAAAGLTRLDLLRPLTPPPIDPGPPDLSAAFRQSDDPSAASQDAEAFAQLCEAMADLIEFDGAQAEPRLRNGVQLDNARRMLRYYQRRGATYGSRYPQLGAAIKGYLDQQLGVDGGPLTDDKRRRWIAAYRQLARSARYAAASLARAG